MSEELGKEYPCFGEFKCPRCNKKWQSSRAWADYGQQCKYCSITVNSYNLQRLFLYICGKCNKKWKWGYVEQGLQCRECSSSTLVRPLDQRNYQDREFIRAHKLEELRDIDDENHIDPNKEHRQDLCEKCKRLGRPCRETAGQDCRSRNTHTHERNVSPSLFYQAHQSIIPSSAPHRVPSASSPPDDGAQAVLSIIFLLVVFCVLFYLFKA
jgi:DNA-directed RNA polymerase subunit RPC12/RpoP